VPEADEEENQGYDRRRHKLLRFRRDTGSVELKSLIQADPQTLFRG